MAKNDQVAVVQRGNTLPVVQTDTEERFVTPSTDVFETSDAYVLMIDLPGAARDSIRVTTENGTMSVKARVEPLHRENAALLFKKPKTPTYHRAFKLAEGIDRKSIEAQYEQGVLTVKLFKKKETKAIEIEIRQQ
jgi:HSP20 family protein